MKKSLLVLFASLLFSSVAQAGAGIDSLNAFFSQVRTLRADFIQYRTDQNGRVTQESKGVLLLQKPGKVRLEYTAPYKQLYVTDGKDIWSYDPDLEQAIVKPMDSAIGDTPILLLSGRSDLQKSFKIVEVHAGKGHHPEDQKLDWVQLTPKRHEAAFKQVRIAFTRSNHELRIMQLQDALGNFTFMEFHHVERNITPAFGAFRFTPPKGVDVISDLPKKQ